MLNKIKSLADEAIKLQNKNRMDEVLREISAMCDVKDESVTVKAEETISSGDIVVATKQGGVKKAKGAKDAE